TGMGANSQIVVGNFGNATMDLMGGAQSTATSAFVGNAAGGTGTLNILSGSSATFTSLTVGTEAPNPNTPAPIRSTVKVEGAAGSPTSRLTVNGTTLIGQQGIGGLEVSGNATATFASTAGTSLTIGLNGNGSLTVKNGGKLDVGTEALATQSVL